MKQATKQNEISQHDISLDGESSCITWDCELEKRNDDAIISLIDALDAHIAKASNFNLSTAAYILRMAKENLISWAAKTAGHETTEEKMINRLLFNNDIFPLVIPHQRFAKKQKS